MYYKTFVFRMLHTHIGVEFKLPESKYLPKLNQILLETRFYYQNRLFY